MNGTAHTNARTDRLQQGGHGIGDIDARKTTVTNILPDKKAIYDGINTGKCKRKHSRQHAAQVGFHHTLSSSSNPVRKASMSCL